MAFSRKVLAGIALWISFAKAFAADDWKTRSNQLAEEYTKTYSQLRPELGSVLGFQEFDKQGVCLLLDIDEQIMRFLRSWETRLMKARQEAKDPELAIDISVLLSSVQRSIREGELEQKYGEIPTAEVANDVFTFLEMLVNEQSPESRRKAAVDRFKFYVKGHGRCKPYALAALDRAREAMAKGKNQPKLYPTRLSIEKYLANSPHLLEGIKDFLSESGRNDWQEEFKIFKGQLARYDQFMKTEVLPKARTTNLPLEMYEHSLLELGIGAKAEELIRKGRDDYKLLYAEFTKLAAQIAHKRGLNASDPLSVVKALKTEQVTRPDEVKALYIQADQELSEIVTRHALVTLPRIPLRIRLADDAESKASPVPHLSPPPLIGNQGERPEFVVPSSSTGQLPFDDFSFKAAALALIAHEGRPGHDLQFSSLIDQGVSTIRARYAFNSVNVEGWALYAEDLVYPYLPLEAQFIALQIRLWRIARMFLDPELQTGRIQAQGVLDLLTKELGLSNEMAQSELDRYTFRNPGQAAAYYYGLLKLKDIRDKAEKQQGKAFSLRCFNDAVIAVGLVPLDLVESRLVHELKCNDAAKDGAAKPLKTP